MTICLVYLSIFWGLGSGSGSGAGGYLICGLRLTLMLLCFVHILCGILGGFQVRISFSHPHFISGIRYFPFYG